MKILIAEDDFYLRDMYKTKCELHGLEVETAINGATAIEKLRYNKYDIVLLDVMLPKINGANIPAMFRDVKFIIASNIDKIDIEKIKRDNMNVIGGVNKMELNPGEICQVISRLGK